MRAALGAFFERSWTAIGLVAVVLAIVLSLPGVQAARADDDAAAPDASFEGFQAHVARKGRPVVVEEAGPTCSAQDPVAVEMAHRRAIAQMQAALMAEARARAAAGEPSDFVVLNGSGYNYRDPQPGENLAPQPPEPSEPAR